MKSGAGERLVHLPLFLVGLLREHLEVHPFPYVFTGERGGWLRRAVFRKQVWLPALSGIGEVEGAGLVSGCGALTFYGLRHTHKTWMAEHRTAPSLQDYRMGHCPRGIAGRYEHPTVVMVAELMRDLEQRWHAAVRGRAHEWPSADRVVSACSHARQQ